MMVSTRLCPLVAILAVAQANVKPEIPLNVKPEIILNVKVLVSEESFQKRMPQFKSQTLNEFWSKPLKVNGGSLQQTFDFVKTFFIHNIDAFTLRFMFEKAQVDEGRGYGVKDSKENHAWVQQEKANWETKPDVVIFLGARHKTLGTHNVVAVSSTTICDASGEIPTMVVEWTKDNIYMGMAMAYGFAALMKADNMLKSQHNFNTNTNIDDWRKYLNTQFSCDSAPIWRTCDGVAFAEIEMTMQNLRVIDPTWPKELPNCNTELFEQFYQDHKACLDSKAAPKVVKKVVKQP